MKNKKVKTIQDRIKEKEIEKEIKEKLKLNKDDTVVVVKKNIFLQILNFVENTLIKILKLLFVIVIGILSTIGLTVLINEPLRNEFFHLIQINFF